MPFCPFLDLGEALVGLRRGRFDEALTLLEGVVDQHPDSVFAPEALWWLGAVQQVAKGDGEALARTRQMILETISGECCGFAGLMSRVG